MKEDAVLNHFPWAQKLTFGSPKSNMIKTYQTLYNAEKPRGCWLQGVSSDSFVWTLGFGWNTIGIPTKLPVEPIQSSAFESCSSSLSCRNSPQQQHSATRSWRWVISTNGTLNLEKRGWDCHWPNASVNLLTQLLFLTSFSSVWNLFKTSLYVRRTWNVLAPEPVQPPFWSILRLVVHLKSGTVQDP